MPKTVECEVRNDLIETCINGDVVTICGVMKTEVPTDAKGGRRGNQNRAALHASYIDANSIRNRNTEDFLSTSAANDLASSMIPN